MTWSDYVAPPSPARAASEVTASSSMGRGGVHPKVTLTIRPHLMRNAPDWLVDGAGVRALIGHGEHVGMIRIVPGNILKLRESRVGRIRDGERRGLILVLRCMPGVGLFKRAVVECDWNDEGVGWLEIRLPRSAAQIAAPVHPALPPTRGFSMTAGVTSREEASRRGCGPVV
jgi:hypothetical protein